MDGRGAGRQGNDESGAGSFVVEQHPENPSCDLRTSSGELTAPAPSHFESESEPAPFAPLALQKKVFQGQDSVQSQTPHSLIAAQ